MQNKCFLLLPLVLAVGCSSGGIGNKESAQEAVDALQSVDSAISVGTNMVDYRQALVPARTEVDQYLAKDSDSEFAQSLSRAMDGHQTANDWWQCEVAQPENSLETRWDAQYRCQDSVFPALFALYPEIEEKVDAVVAGLQSPPKYKSGSLDSDAILQYIWQQTSADTAKAIEAL
ncbi:MAG: hypothetical protein WBA43_19095 [Elainellaceae cyanobacterium]